MNAFWSAVGLRLLMPAIGAAAALATLPLLVPRVGLGELERVRLLGLRIEQAAASGEDIGAVFLVGNSVTIEGLDADRVAAATGGPVRNYAINGSRLEDTAVILPRLLDARPRAIVLSLMPTHLFETRPTTPDEAYAYALGDLVDRSLVGERLYPNDTTAAFDASTVRALAHFRSAPLRSLDDTLRMHLAPGRRTNAADDWSCPNLLTADAPAAACRAHLERVRELLRSNRPDPARLALLERMQAHCESRRTRFFLCLAPVHPDLQADCPSGLAGLDFQTLLEANQFADAVHPNAEGRAVFSDALGPVLRRALVRDAMVAWD